MEHAESKMIETTEVGVLPLVHPAARHRYSFSSRLSHIEPFQVMQVMGRANELEAQGRSIIYMVLGEPDFPTAQPIVQAGIDALKAGKTYYTHDLGLPALRSAIARSYAPEAIVDAECVVVTPGSSGALQLILGALLSPGDEILLADPGYPCSRQIVRMFEGVPKGIGTDAATSFQLSAELIRQHWTPRTVAVLVASPSNPVGTIIPDPEMRRIVETVEELGGLLIVDEIYHGLTYGINPSSVAGTSDRVFVVNSFSKYYGMTGWRVGWLIAPPDYVPMLEKLAQNVFLCASTPGQYAALAAFQAPARVELERRRQIFCQRRDYLVTALRSLGFKVPIEPQGAFYIYADCSALASNSDAFALQLLETAGVAVAPGSDFGFHHCEQYVRFSYTSDISNLQEGIRRIAAFLNQFGNPTDT